LTVRGRYRSLKRRQRNSFEVSPCRFAGFFYPFLKKRDNANFYHPALAGTPPLKGGFGGEIKNIFFCEKSKTTF